MTGALERFLLDASGVRIPFCGTPSEAIERARMIARAVRASVTVLRPGGGELARVDPRAEV